ncbi:MAG: hypothetical protein ABEI77_10345 [Halorientalis sp.]
MSDRAAELRALASEISDHETVDDAWLAKSFTDMLLVVDLPEGTTLPAEIRDSLADHDLYGSNEVYDMDDTDQSFVGTVSNGNRHQFVDVRTRGEHQSYVID